MSASQDKKFSDRLSWLETFRSAAWGKNHFLKQSTRISRSKIRTIEYLDLGEHFWAVKCFCRALSKEKIIVFEEYRAAMLRFKEGDVEYKKGACIVGDPGIGKSCFVLYAVIERLREEQPVAVQVRWSTTDLYLLFTANSVTIHEDPLDYHSQIWAFSDSTGDILIPMSAFRNTIKADVRIFQTISPAIQRWKDWTQHRNVNLYTMDAPTIEEVEDLAFLSGKDVVRMEALASKWGPVPRVLMAIFTTSAHEVHFEQEVTMAIYETIRNPGSVFAAIAAHNTLATFSDSSRVFFTKSKSKSDRYLHSTYIPTSWLMSRLVDELVQKGEDVKAEFFDVISDYFRMHFISGSMIMELIHCFLARGENFTIRWYGREIGTGGPVLTVPPDSFGLKALKSAFEIDVGTGTSGGPNVTMESTSHDDGDNGDEHQNVRASKRRRIHTDT